jgi:dienelactone hydrolase
MRSQTISAVVVVVVGVLPVAGCGWWDDDSLARPGAPGTYEVSQLTETFVDQSRRTEAPDPAASAPNRTLETLITYPKGEGPFPLIVLAHGQTGHPDKFMELTTAWASAGYVIAGPVFPLTSNQATFETVGDYVNQPADMSFVIDQMIEFSGGDGPLAGLVDGDRIGATGLSLGGSTAYGLAFDECCRDERVDAITVMAGQLLPFDESFEWPSVPLFIIHGQDDNLGEPYTRAAPPKYVMTIQRPIHSAPFEDTPDEADSLVVTVTIDFWHGYLYEADEALDALESDANIPRVATLKKET